MGRAALCRPSSSNPTVELNVKQLKKWIQKLPVNDAILTFNLLGKAIKPFNELIISDSNRLKLLEVYYEAISKMVCGVDGLHSDQMSQENICLIADDLVSIFLELANGYKIIIKNSQIDDPKISSDSLLLAIYRAMELISLSIMGAWGANSETPPLAYLEINQLYYFVCKHGINSTKIKQIKNESDNAVIDRLYAQFGLMSIGVPYKLTFNELYQLFGLFESFVKYCSIGQNVNGNPSFLYAVNLMEDMGHSLLNHQDKTSNLEDSESRLNIERAVEAMTVWYKNQKNVKTSLFLQNELEWIKNYLDRVVGSSEDTKISENTKDKLEFSQEDEVKLAFGLDMLKFILESNIVIDNQTMIPLSKWAIDKKNQKGYLLSGSLSTEIEEPNVGDVAAIFDSANVAMGIHYPTIGIIRSMQFSDESHVTLGLEVVSGKPIPITCFAVDPVEECFQEYLALYFPSNRELNQPAAVLADKKLHDQGCSFLVYIKSRAFAIKPRQQLIESPVLTCFSFKVLKD